MMMVLANMYQLNKTKSFGMMTDKKMFKEKIKALFDVIEVMNLGETGTVKGSDLFIIGKEGAIGNYGNASSRRQFVDRINVKFLEQMYAALARE